MNIKTDPLLKALIVALILFLFLFQLKNRLNAWEGEYWTQMNATLFESDPYRIYTVVEVRIDDNFTDLYFFRFTQNFAYQLRPFLGVEAHYSFIYDRPPGAFSFIETHRIEFEVNPSWDLSEKAKLLCRNRFELIKSNGNPSFRQTFRHRSMIVFPVENQGSLTAISVSEEVFYHFNQREFTQSRFIPLQLSFKVNPKVVLDLYVMVRNFFATRENRWLNHYVLASQLTF